MGSSVTGQKAGRCKRKTIKLKVRHVDPQKVFFHHFRAFLCYYRENAILGESVKAEELNLVKGYCLPLAQKKL